jgi:Phosphotransferase enzyme family
MPASQQIGEEQALRLFRLASGGRWHPGGDARVAGQKKGSINQIFHIESGEEQFALRVRYNESNFQYEKGVFKEVFAALLLDAYKRDRSAALDPVLMSLWGTLSGQRSENKIVFSCGPDIYYFDFTLSEYDGPWALLEWTGYALCHDLNNDHAFRLGQLVSDIHRIKFQRAYCSLQNIPLSDTDILEVWHHEIAIRNRNTGYIAAPEAALLKHLAGLCDASRAAATGFVLCHNDLHCLNVTQKRGSLHLVDWDNAQIAPKELDFVKLAHWSRLGADGHFEPDAAIFAAFCAGYGTTAAGVLSSPIFQLAELLWLFRVLEFAGRFEEPATPPFWPPQRYTALIRQRLEP